MYHIVYIIYLLFFSLTDYYYMKYNIMYNIAGEIKSHMPLDSSFFLHSLSVNLIFPIQ